MPYPFYQQYYPQNYQNQQIPPQAQNGLIGIPSENDARNYPVAYGNSAIFKDENAPYIYTKTMGFSQLEPPKFEKYRLIKEEATEQAPTTTPEKTVEYIEKSEFDSLKAEIDSLKADADKLKSKQDELKGEVKEFKTDFKVVKSDVNKLVNAKKKKEVMEEDDE